MKRFLFPILICIFIGVMAFAGYKLWEQYNEYEEGEDAYIGLEQYIDIPSPPAETITPTPFETEKPVSGRWDDIQWPEVNFEELAEVNPDIIGWLYCEDTVINYPIVQGSDNTYYLRHLFDGSYNTAGCLFLDAQNTADLSDTHNIIYGHHLKSGKMFASLDGYKKQEYYDEHPLLLLMTPEANYVIEVFAGHVATVSDNAWNLGLASGPELMDFAQAAIEKSTFDCEAFPVDADKIITLSTCSYEFNDARYVLLGIMHQAQL